MSFLLCCPTCGERSVYEFRFGGEFHQRPPGSASTAQWADYLYARANPAGPQKEWWYHQLGCRTWFFAVRDTLTNTVLETVGADKTTDEA
jgi:sarcosine oxidase subunit delta